MANLTPIDLAVLAAYFLVVFGIGFYFSRRERTSTDYFLASRDVGWFAVGASLFATNISSEHFIGLAGSGAATGLAVGCFEWSASICLVLLAWVFVPFYLRSRVFTMPEFLERRYDGRCRAFLSWFSLLAYVFTKISVALFAGALLLRQVVGWDTLTSALALVVATGIYTIAGGLAAVIYTDLFQAFVLLAGSALLTWVGMDRVGGFAGLRQAVPTDFFHMVKPLDHPQYPWLGTLVAPLVLGIWYWCTDQVIVQKVLGARDVLHARTGALFCGFLKILPVFVLIVPGLIAKALWPAEATGDSAYGLLVVRLLPGGVMGFMVAALLAALMSSLSSVFNSCSTLITFDLYRKRHPDASEARLVRVGRISTALVVVLSIGWIPIIRYISSELYIYLQSVQSYIGPPIMVCFFVGVFWKRANAAGAIATLATGLLVGGARLGMEILQKSAGMSFGPLDPLVRLNFLLFSLILTALCAAVMFAVSMTTAAPAREKVEGLTWARRGEARIGEGSARGRAIAGWTTALLVATIVGLWSYFA
jgi:SSS family solute:Na+ symporter